MPCHHALAEALRAYIDAAGIAEDRKGWLFRTARGHKADTLSELAMNQSDAWCMIRRRAKAAGIAAEIGCHTFRATGITAYLANGGAREPAQEMAAHESPRTTKLHDRTKERLTQDEVERIRVPSTIASTYARWSSRTSEHRATDRPCSSCSGRRFRRKRRLESGPFIGTAEKPRPV